MWTTGMIFKRYARTGTLYRTSQYGSHVERGVALRDVVKCSTLQYSTEQQCSTVVQQIILTASEALHAALHCTALGGTASVHGIAV
jgi:hypothetical protein